MSDSRDGELTSVAGEHTLASLIQAHITIKGGVLLWPMYNMENGIGGTSTFENGLLCRRPEGWWNPGQLSWK